MQQRLRSSILLIVAFFSLIISSEAMAFSRKGISLQIPSKWTIQKPNNKNIILSLQNGNIATINIYEVSFSGPITITGFYQMRTKLVYSDWNQRGARPGTAYETDGANADYSYVGLYASSKGANQIVGEYFFMKGRKGYIVSIVTQSQSWKRIESDVKIILDSFWIGNVPRLFHLKPESMNMDWMMVGRNSANWNNIDTPRLNLSALAKKWGLTTDTRDIEVSSQSPVESKGRIFLNIANTMMCLNALDGTQNWSYKMRGKILNDLLVQGDVLYFILYGNGPSLYAVFTKNGNTLFKKALPGKQYAHPISSQDQLFLVDETALRALELDTGNLRWEDASGFNPEFYPVVLNNVVMAIKSDNSLVAFDAHSGAVLWRKQFSDKILFSPIMVNGLVILCTQATNASAVIWGIDLTTGSDAWRFTQSSLIYSISARPAIVNNRLIVIGETGLDSEGRAHILTIDPQTGRAVTQYGISDISGYNLDRPVYSKNAIYLLRTLVETKVLSIKKELEDESPVASEYVEKKQDYNMYLMEINLSEGKSRQVLIGRNSQLNPNDILGFNIYGSSLVLIQNNPAKNQLYVKCIR